MSPDEIDDELWYYRKGLPMNSILEDKKAAAKRLIELREAASETRWKYDPNWRACAGQKVADMDFIEHCANHAAQLAEDFLEAVTALEKWARIEEVLDPNREGENIARACLEKLGAE